MLKASLAVAMPHMPGVSTPSEVQTARAAGCGWLKVFPASLLGPKWLSAVRGPFPDVEFLATGGMTFEAAHEYVSAGARIVAFGAAAVDQDRYDDLEALVKALR
ncbi:hypothetical protein Areg01_31120 [Actinoplanes regularis]|nr:hypothetical protein Areg01_31120 [Actinoplanes regularis]